MTKSGFYESLMNFYEFSFPLNIGAVLVETLREPSPVASEW